jgi:hypothetical protein
MKKILLFVFAFLLVGCTNPQEAIDKDKAFLKSLDLRYDQLVLRWEEPHAVKYLSTYKFIATWKKDLGFGQIYDVRILFERQRVVSWKIDDSNIKRSFLDEVIASLQE